MKNLFAPCDKTGFLPLVLPLWGRLQRGKAGCGRAFFRSLLDTAEDQQPVSSQSLCKASGAQPKFPFGGEDWRCDLSDVPGLGCFPAGSQRAPDAAAAVDLLRTGAAAFLIRAAALAASA